MNLPQPETIWSFGSIWQEEKKSVEFNSRILARAIMMTSHLVVLFRFRYECILYVVENNVRKVFPKIVIISAYERQSKDKTNKTLQTTFNGGW